MIEPSLQPQPSPIPCILLPPNSIWKYIFPHTPPTPTPIRVQVWVISRFRNTFYPCLQPGLQPQPSPIPCILLLPNSVWKYIYMYPHQSPPPPSTTHIRVQVWVISRFRSTFYPCLQPQQSSNPCILLPPNSILNIMPPPPTPIRVWVWVISWFKITFYSCLQPQQSPNPCILLFPNSILKYLYPPPIPIIVQVWVISRFWSTFYPCLPPSLQPQPLLIPCILLPPNSIWKYIFPHHSPSSRSQSHHSSGMSYISISKHILSMPSTKTVTKSLHSSPSEFNLEIYSVSIPIPPNPTIIRVQVWVISRFRSTCYPCHQPCLQPSQIPCIIPNQVQCLNIPPPFHSYSHHSSGMSYISISKHILSMPFRIGFHQPSFPSKSRTGGPTSNFCKSTEASYV